MIILLKVLYILEANFSDCVSLLAFLRSVHVVAKVVFNWVKCLFSAFTYTAQQWKIVQSFEVSFPEIPAFVAFAIIITILFVIAYVMANVN